MSILSVETVPAISFPATPKAANVFESRYYHAVFGRFIAPDTIVPNLYDPQSLNRYSYARNNPLYYTDPSGHFFWAVVALGVVARVVSSGATPRDGAIYPSR
ncbi:MAG: hypothetical protein MRJ68_20295 [Nitrospira sp.]|nr:hypothetical protein [Nitrospira sp.]